MTTFMDKDFLLNTETARKLYHDYAASCPIIDYHCPHQPEGNLGRPALREHHERLAGRRPLQVARDALRGRG